MKVEELKGNKDPKRENSKNSKPKSEELKLKIEKTEEKD